MNGGTTHAPCTRPGSTPCSDSTSPNRGKTLPTGPSTRAPQSASQPSVRRRVQNAATACSVASPSWSSSAPSCGMSKIDVRSFGLALGGLPEPSERPSPPPPAGRGLVPSKRGARGAHAIQESEAPPRRACGEHYGRLLTSSLPSPSTEQRLEPRDQSVGEPVGVGLLERRARRGNAPSSQRGGGGRRNTAAPVVAERDEASRGAGAAQSSSAAAHPRRVGEGRHRVRAQRRVEVALAGGGGIFEAVDGEGATGSRRRAAEPRAASSVAVPEIRSAALLPSARRARATKTHSALSGARRRSLRTTRHVRRAPEQRRKAVDSCRSRAASEVRRRLLLRRRRRRRSGRDDARGGCAARRRASCEERARDGATVVEADSRRVVRRAKQPPSRRDDDLSRRYSPCNRLPAARSSTAVAPIIVVHRRYGSPQSGERFLSRGLETSLSMRAPSPRARGRTKGAERAANARAARRRMQLPTLDGRRRPNELRCPPPAYAVFQPPPTPHSAGHKTLYLLYIKRTEFRHGGFERAEFGGGLPRKKAPPSKLDACADCAGPRAPRRRAARRPSASASRRPRAATPPVRAASVAAEGGGEGGRRVAERQGARRRGRSGPVGVGGGTRRRSRGRRAGVAAGRTALAGGGGREAVDEGTEGGVGGGRAAHPPPAPSPIRRRRAAASAAAIARRGPRARAGARRGGRGARGRSRRRRRSRAPGAAAAPAASRTPPRPRRGGRRRRRTLARELRRARARRRRRSTRVGARRRRRGGACSSSSRLCTPRRRRAAEAAAVAPSIARSTRDIWTPREQRLSSSHGFGAAQKPPPSLKS